MPLTINSKGEFVDRSDPIAERVERYKGLAAANQKRRELGRRKKVMEFVARKGGEERQ